MLNIIIYILCFINSLLEKLHILPKIPEPIPYEKGPEGFDFIIVTVTKSGGPQSWYRDKIGKKFLVRKYKDERIVLYDLVRSRGKSIMKDDCVTLNQNRKRKLNKILDDKKN